MDMSDLIARIQATPDCQVFAPMEMPAISKEHLFADDLRHFYTLCGGVRLFEGRDYAWYIIVDDGNGEYLTVDLSRERLGRCYDSFFDRHGVAGSCPIIAPSFTDLLTRLFENQGQYWYWLRSDFVSLGDAYDGVS